MIPEQAPAPAPTRIVLTGAHGGFGRTFLSQLLLRPDQTPVQLVDPDTAGTAAMLADLGYPTDSVITASRAETADAVRSDRIALVAGADAVDWDGVDVLVEATGRVDAGHGYAQHAIDNGVHVIMISKEVESFAGVALAAAAEQRGVRYLPGDGDQPANLLRLLAWTEQLGLDVVALGKSGEYDLVFDPTTGTVSQLDASVQAPALFGLLDLGDDLQETLAARAEAVASLKRRAAADLCEMAVVSLHSGARADAESLHYPVARPAELADIYSRVDDGGIITRSRSVDVFSMLRLPGEASFAGGVFVVVRVHDQPTWELLAGKGHIVSRSGRHACIAWPFHLMGVETVRTVDLAMHGGGDRCAPPRQHTVLAARAADDLEPGTTFSVHGHHHEIAGVLPVIVDREVAAAADGAPTAAPYYLLSGACLTKPVGAGELIMLDDLDQIVDEPWRGYLDGFAR